MRRCARRKQERNPARISAAPPEWPRLSLAKCRSAFISGMIGFVLPGTTYSPDSSVLLQNKTTFWNQHNSLCFYTPGVASPLHKSILAVSKLPDRRPPFEPGDHVEREVVPVLEALVYDTFSSVAIVVFVQSAVRGQVFAEKTHLRPVPSKPRTKSARLPHTFTIEQRHFYHPPGYSFSLPLGVSAYHPWGYPLTTPRGVSLIPLGVKRSYP